MGYEELVPQAVAVVDIDAGMRSEMYAVFVRSYANVSEARFTTDLAGKKWVIVLRGADSGAIHGFSTLTVDETSIDGQPILVAFSGDTIIDRDHWGGQQLVKAWFELMERVRVENLPKPMYWFLICKGYRTYLYLPTFFNAFYPRYGVTTPQFEARLMDQLATARYLDTFDRKRGVISFPQSHGNLTDELAAVPDHRVRDPNVRFFLEANPRFAEGDELVCLTRFEPANLNPRTLRFGGSLAMSSVR